MVLLGSLVANGTFLAGVALLIVILLRRWHRYFGRRRRGSKDTSGLVLIPRSSDKPQRSLSTAPPEFLQWQVEMHEAARAMKAEIDSKMVTLQILTQAATEQADRLERFLETCRSCTPAGEETAAQDDTT